MSADIEQNTGDSINQEDHSSASLTAPDSIDVVTISEEKDTGTLSTLKTTASVIQGDKLVVSVTHERATAGDISVEDFDHDRENHRDTFVEGVMTSNEKLSQNVKEQLQDGESELPSEKRTNVQVRKDYVQDEEREYGSEEGMDGQKSSPKETEVLQNVEIKYERHKGNERQSRLHIATEPLEKGTEQQDSKIRNDIDNVDRTEFSSKEKIVVKKAMHTVCNSDKIVHQNQKKGVRPRKSALKTASEDSGIEPKMKKRKTNNSLSAEYSDTSLPKNDDQYETDVSGNTKSCPDVISEFGLKDLSIRLSPVDVDDYGEKNKDCIKKTKNMKKSKHKVKDDKAMRKIPGPTISTKTTKKKVGRPRKIKIEDDVDVKKKNMPKCNLDYVVEESDKDGVRVKLFKCKHCEYSTSYKAAYIRHFLKHSIETKKCRFCEFQTRSSLKLVEHEAQHTKEKPFKCDKCEYRCRYRVDIYHHQAKHLDKKKFRCPHEGCNFITKWRRNVSHHLKSHQIERPHACHLCDMTFKRPHDLKYHLYRHSDDKPKQCDQCSFRCKSNYEIRMHKLKHSNVRPFPCTYPGCKQACKVKSDLVKHMLIHSDVKNFLCPLCGKGFKSQTQLNKHNRTHSDVRPYGCDICEKRFKFFGALRQHLRNHQGIKPFECDICGHLFSNKSNRDKHLITHNYVHRPFRCPICPYGARVQEHLLAHIGTMHGQLYAFFCELCKKPFKRYSQLKVHHSRMHTVEEFNRYINFLGVNTKDVQKEIKVEMVEEGLISREEINTMQQTLLEQGDSDGDNSDMEESIPPSRPKTNGDETSKLLEENSNDEVSKDLKSGGRNEVDEISKDVEVSEKSNEAVNKPSVAKKKPMNVSATLAIYDGFRLPLFTKGFEYNIDKSGKKPKTWFMEVDNMPDDAKWHQQRYFKRLGRYEDIRARKAESKRIFMETGEDVKIDLRKGRPCNKEKKNEKVIKLTKNGARRGRPPKKKVFDTDVVVKTEEESYTDVNVSEGKNDNERKKRGRPKCDVKMLGKKMVPCTSNGKKQSHRKKVNNSNSKKTQTLPERTSKAASKTTKASTRKTKTKSKSKKGIPSLKLKLKRKVSDQTWTSDMMNNDKIKETKSKRQPRSRKQHTEPKCRKQTARTEKRKQLTEVVDDFVIDWETGDMCDTTNNVEVKQEKDLDSISRNENQKEVQLSTRDDTSKNGYSGSLYGVDTNDGDDQQKPSNTTEVSDSALFECKTETSATAFYCDDVIVLKKSRECSPEQPGTGVVVDTVPHYNMASMSQRYGMGAIVDTVPNHHNVIDQNRLTQNEVCLSGIDNGSGHNGDGLSSLLLSRSEFNVQVCCNPGVSDVIVKTEPWNGVY